MKRWLTPIALIALASPLAAQEHEAEQREAVEEGEEYLNGLDVFLGATTEVDPTSTAFTIGLGYVRRLSPLFSVGAAGEFAASSTLREWLIFGLGYVRPAGDLLLGTGPGHQWDREGDVEGEELEESREFVWRFVASWEAEVGRRYTISPEVNLDLVGGEVVWVYGVAFGVMF